MTLRRERAGGHDDLPGPGQDGCPVDVVLPRVWLGVLALAVGVAIGATGIAYAAIPDPDGVIHGCVGKGNGAMRVIDPSTTLWR